MVVRSEHAPYWEELCMIAYDWTGSGLLRGWKLQGYGEAYSEHL